MEPWQHESENTSYVPSFDLVPVFERMLYEEFNHAHMMISHKMYEDILTYSFSSIYTAGHATSAVLRINLPDSPKDGSESIYRVYLLSLLPKSSMEDGLERIFTENGEPLQISFVECSDFTPEERDTLSHIALESGMDKALEVVTKVREERKEREKNKGKDGEMDLNSQMSGYSQEEELSKCTNPYEEK